MKIKAAIYSVVIIATFLLTSNMVQGQGKDYTFCLGSISVTLKDGGPAIMNRYSIDGQLILSLGGEWTAYGSPNDMPGQTIRIKYNGSSELFRYDLIRDGFGNPSVLIDGNGRNYKLCNTSSS